MKRFLCFGDSIVAGSDLPSEEQGQTWPAMANEMAGGAFECLNAGRGGRPTDALAEFKEALEKEAPVDIALLALGTNDSRDLSEECPRKAAGNLEAMVHHAQRVGVPRVVIVAPADLCLEALGETKPVGPRRQRQLDRMTEAFRALAVRLDTEFIGLAGVVSSRHLARDGVHPNAAGNRQIARHLLPLLLKLAGD